MSDPYVVLGVSRDATDEQIKTAYRELAKKYHPDKYVDTPLADVAAEKMKEVNEAYDFIMDQRKRGNNTGSGYNNSGGYSGTGYSSFINVRNLMSQGNFGEAERILDGVAMEARNAEWHFLKGTIQFNRGFLEQAIFNINTACNMDPGNAEYANARSRIYAQQNGNFGGYNVGNMNNNRSGSSCNACDVCSGLLCADCCCECMGGDLIRCC